MTSFVGPIEYGTLVGVFTRAENDGGVIVRVPRIGTVTITADVIESRVMADSDIPVETISIDPIVVALDSDGSIGEVPVILPSSVRPDDFTYHVEFSFDETDNPEGFSFSVPSTDAVDLTLVTPVKPYPGTPWIVGPAGPPGVNTPPTGTPDGYVATSEAGVVTYRAQDDVMAAAVSAVAAALAASPPGNAVGTKGYLLLTGDSTGPCVQCSASPNYGGSFELIIDDLSLANLNNGASQTLWSIQNSTTQNAILRENSSGKLALLVYAAPGTGTAVTGTASVVTPAGLTSLRIVWDQPTGRLIFWKPSTIAYKSTTGATVGAPNQKTFNDPNASFGPQHVGMVLYSSVFTSSNGYTTIQSINSPTSVHTADNAANAVASGISYTVGAVLTDSSKWENIGVPQTAQLPSGAARYASSSMPMTIGAVGNGTQLAAAGTKIGKVRYYSGYELPDGTGTKTLLADPTFSGRDTAIAAFTDTESNVWSMVGTALIVAKTMTITKDGQVYTVVTPGYLQTRLGTYNPSDYGDLTISDESRRFCVQSAIDDAYRNGGGAVPFHSLLTVGPNSSLKNPLTGLNYAAIHAKDKVRLYAEDPQAHGLKLANGASCHLVAHPGRLQGGAPPNEQDNIQGFSIRGMLLDGNKANQDQTHDHDGLRFPQYPKLRVEDAVIQNCDGHGYYSSANGDFASPSSDIGQNANATLVKPLWLQTVSFYTNARWGAMMSATNRKTHEKDLYANGNGTAQARIVGKRVNPVISVGGTLALTIDSNLTVASIALAAGDAPTGPSGTNFITKINAVLGSTATATMISNRLAITSATTGGVSWVGTDSSSTTSVLNDLGLSLITSAGPIPGLPMHLNGENDAAVGGGEYGGFYADHSEAGTDHWFADSNIGIGVYVHNVQLCDFGLFHSNNNNGIGVYVRQMNTSKIRTILAAMNCQDPGYASYMPRNIRNFSNVLTPTPKTEVLFTYDTGGYGPSNYSSVQTLIAPGLMTYGPLADNRKADCSLAIEKAVSSSLTFERLIYGDGGLNGDGLGPTIRDYR